MANFINKIQFKSEFMGYGNFNIFSPSKIVPMQINANVNKSILCLPQPLMFCNQNVTIWRESK